jgi:parallel beta-helix repeat protein
MARGIGSPALGIGARGPRSLAALGMTLVLSTSLAAQPTIELRPGLVITRSVRVAPKTYRIPGSDSGVITIRGNDIVVDFGGATLAGIAPGDDPDGASGIGIRIDGGRNVVVRNARIRGYKVGLLARGTRGLTLARNDFSYNWKPRLFSVMEHESLADWLSHHKNEKDEWLRFGAGVYLSDVRGGELRDNRIVQGMEGLMMVRTDSVRVWNNVIEFNSGVGIGMYRSSDNTIMHNRASYNVRGYSHGHFRRGQDSADLLMYEQSSRNVVAYNSMTHGGDGLFLWAGQSTMDTGQGGSNDNLFFANDFSFAPTNGMEATFSRNTFFNNRVEGSDHGLWGGYSYDSRVIGNDFIRNRVGVAIEHGQNNLIGANKFTSDTTAIYLWANPIEPTDWGYPKHRDTRSRDYAIVSNVFTDNRVALRVSNTTGTTMMNHFERVDSQMVRRDSVDLREDQGAGPSGSITGAPRLKGAIDALATDTLGKRDRAAIIIDEWGPYDWRSPKLWPVDTSRRSVRLRVLGPVGTWRIASKRGVSGVSAERGRVGDTLTVTPGSRGDWSVTLEYRGQAIVSPRGERTNAGAPYYFSYERVEPTSSWEVRFFAWSDTAELRNFAVLQTKTPIATDRRERLDYFWYRPTLPGLPQEKWAAVATGAVNLGSGTFSVRTISDDGVRVWIDGTLAIDNWKPHESEVDYAPLSAGRHDIRVEYVQVGGWTELRLDVVRGANRSTGSPGPH